MKCQIGRYQPIELILYVISFARIEVTIKTSRDLSRQVVKSDYASVTVPEIELTIPQGSQKAGRTVVLHSRYYLLLRRWRLVLMYFDLYTENCASWYAACFLWECHSGFSVIYRLKIASTNFKKGSNMIIRCT